MSKPKRYKKKGLSSPITWLLILLLLLVIAGALIGGKFLLASFQAPITTLISPFSSPTSIPKILPSPSPTSTPYSSTTFEVLAAEGWQDTGVRVSEGNNLEITYINGIWTGKTGNNLFSGPEGGHPSLDYSCNPISHKESGFNALIGKIWYGMPFMVGGHFTGTADITGTLYLRMNDCDIWLADNEGSVVVSIQVRK